MAQGYESILMSSPLFAGFTEHGAKSVLETGEIIVLERGEVFFREGDGPDSVAFLLEGEVQAYVERDGVEIVFGTMGAGALIGELAVLCEAPRAASVRAPDQATFLKWDANGFRRLLLRNTHLAQKVFSQAMKVVLENQQALIEKLTRQEEGA